MTATKSTTTRELFVRTRRAWKDGSRIEIDFTSVRTNDKGEVTISNYSVTLWVDDRNDDTCTCMGFSRWGHCCHLEHFVVVEDVRRQIVVAEQSAPSIQTVVALINLTTGKQVVKIGVPTEPVVSERDTALAEARAASEAELARIEAETLAQIAEEQAVTPGVGKSEQARLADLPLSNDERKYQRWSREERVNSAPLNGNRAFSVLKSA